MRWVSLRKTCATELNLYHTLLNGQCFNWRLLQGAGGAADRGLYAGVLRGHVLHLRHDPKLDLVRYRCLNVEDDNRQAHAAVEALLQDYFQLDAPPLSTLYAEWSKGCPRMKDICGALPGMRVLRQDPFECLLSFICSSNNNIPRIKQMLEKLRTHYGSKILLHAKEAEMADEGSPHFAFPTLEQMSAATEKELRDLGFGYRAKFIVRTVAKLEEEGEDWLERLRDEKEVETVRSKLMELYGVGRKVADCVALFSLDQRGVVPVDTHVWQIACRYYDPSLASKASLTNAVYQSVNDAFIQRFGPCAGWAHCLLFAAELPEYRTSLPDHIIKEQEEQIQLEKLAKAKSKEKKAKESKTRKKALSQSQVQRPTRRKKRKGSTRAYSTTTSVANNANTKAKRRRKRSHGRSR